MLPSELYALLVGRAHLLGPILHGAHSLFGVTPEHTSQRDAATACIHVVGDPGGPPAGGHGRDRVGGDVAGVCAEGGQRVCGTAAAQV